MKLLNWFSRHKVTLYYTIGYLTAGIILLIFFLYLTFPWEKLSNYVEIQTEKFLGSVIDIRESEVKFPLKMTWSGVSIRPQTAQKTIRVNIDRISLEWTVRSLLKRRLDLIWSIQAAGGRGRGRIAGQTTDRGMQYRLTGDLKELDLGKIIEFVNPNVHEIEGTLALKQMQHDWVGGNFTKGVGMADLELVDGRIGTLDLIFTHIRGKISMRGGVAQINNILALGPSLELRGSGNIVFRPKFPDSLVNLNTRATVKDSSGPLALLAGSSSMARPGKAIELSLRGPLRRLTFFLNGASLFKL